MPHNCVSVKTAEKIRDAWFSKPKPKNPQEVMRRAGLKVTDDRNVRRYRRQTEDLLGISLPSLNPEKLNIEDTATCPSFLDLSKAKKKTEFVITSATNNSRLNEKFFDALELFCDERDAQLLVCPIKYWHSALMGKKDYKWPSRIYPYAVTDKDLILNKSIQISALSAKATAVDPLGGLKPLGGNRSVIYGATSLHMRCLPSHGKSAVKMIHTTGSCTSKSYTRTVAGLKAKFHHNFSAVFVKLIGDKYLHTQLMWDGKGFVFLNQCYTPSGVQDAPQCAAIVRGDDHAEWQEKAILDARGRACERLNVKTHVFHDVFDAVSVSHHTQLMDKVKIHEAGLDSLEKGLKATADLIDRTGGEQNLIIESNHDRHLERYVNEGRHLKQPHNFALASDLAARALKSNKPMLRCYLEKNCKRKLTFPDLSKPKLIKGIDVSQHGDKGANGARGSMKTFAGMQHRMCVGHSHTAWIFQGAWGAGVSTKSMPYAVGLSSWTYADIFIAGNGKRFMLFYVGGKSLADYI